MNKVARAMTKGEQVYHSRGCDSAITTGIKIPFPSCTCQCMSKLCSKFQIHASNAIVGIAKEQLVLKLDMDKICMSFKEI